MQVEFGKVVKVHALKGASVVDQAGHPQLTFPMGDGTAERAGS